MANASHDENRIPTLLGVSSVDGVTPIPVYVDPVTHRLLVSSSAAAGDVNWNGNANGAKKTIGSTDNQDIGLITNNTERVTVLKDGNVGIGTTAPSKRLHVAGTSASHEMQTDVGLNLYYVPSPTSLSGVVSSGGSVDNGAHYYAVTFVTAIGESRPYFISSAITTTAGNNTVTLTIPVSTDYRVTARKIYRTKAGANAYDDYLLTTVNDNTTTSYVDTAADSSLTGSAGASYFRTNTTNYGIRFNDVSVFATDSQYTKLGYAAASSLTIGGRGVAVGSGAQQNVTSGFDNHTLGQSGMTSLTTGSGNCGFGYGIMQAVTTGYYNSAFGHDAMIYAGTTSSYNAIFGAYAGFGSSGNSVYNYSTILGAYAGYSLRTGLYNTFLGYQAGYATTTGEKSLFLGNQAGKYETSGYTLIVDTFDRSNESAQRTGALIYGIFNSTPANQILSLGGGGRVGINIINPTSSLHLPAGTATASTAPLKFTSGVNLTIPESGAIEFDGTNFYITPSTTRYSLLSTRELKTDLTDNSDSYIASQKAVKTAVDAKAPSANPTFTGTVVLPKTLEIQDTSADHQYVLAVNELTADRTVTLPLLTDNDEFTFNAHTQTLTNKRVTPRITTITSHATPTINTDNCDAVTITAQAEAITSMTTNLSGTPTNFQKLIIRIKDNGTARAITWGTSFEAKGVALPTTTVLSKVLTVGFIYDTVTSKWGCVASAQEA